MTNLQVWNPLWCCPPPPPLVIRKGGGGSEMKVCWVVGEKISRRKSSLRSVPNYLLHRVDLGFHYWYDLRDCSSCCFLKVGGGWCWVGDEKYFSLN